MKLFSSLVYCGSRLRQTSGHFMEAIGASGIGGGILYIRDGINMVLSRLFNMGRGKPRELSDFDRKWGTDTSVRVNHLNLGVSLDKAVGVTSYMPTEAGRFHNLISRLDIDFGDYTFIDCGSGKGLVLFLASNYPFKKIIGVELSPILHEVAGGNLGKQRSQSQRCSNIDLVCQDLTEYEFPTEPSTVYFFNPFREAVFFEKVLTRLENSLAACPRDLILIYLNPVYFKHLQATSALELIHEVRFSSEKEDWAAIFRSKKNKLAFKGAI